ncbi:MAG: hypothetical protein MJY99_05320 [Fibrobacter sp.]|nr:hypothetical protein [Fibrobacter sp.]
MRTYKDLALAEEEGKLENAIQASRNLLVEAPTGSGKSLYIPWFLSRHFTGRIVVLQPRRIAALSLAQYSAKLHGEPCGKTVGYQFRQDSCKSASTRILFQTYGNFLQELLHGKMDAEWVIFDEYHERKADMDLLFAYLLKLQASQAGEKKTAPRIAVMSAKLNREEMEKSLGVKCQELGHPLYPVQILHQTPAAGVILTAGVGIENEVVRALRTLYRNNIWKTTLVFLPGKAEISRCHTAAAEALGTNCAEFLELYGGQDRETQDKIFEETESPRVIFTTNIAETSVTVPNVSGVVDSGIERTSEYDDSEKVNVLRTLPISLQNAIQRSGRSGRTQNGCAIRLWSEDAETRMAKGIVPEITQIEPSEIILQKASLESRLREGDSANGAPATAIQMPTAIPAAREQAATQLLQQFGMLENGRITALGEKAIMAPISNIPLALLLASAKNAADLPDLLLAAMAWIHSGTEFTQKAKFPLNLLTLANDTLEGNSNAPREVTFTLRQLRDYRENVFGKGGLTGPRQSFANQRQSFANQRQSSETVCRQLLKAFPDRLATPNGNAYKLPNQNIVRLQVTEPPYALLALTMLRTGGGSKSELKVSLYAPVNREMLANESESTRYELLWRSGQERFIGIEITESGDGENTRELSRKEIVPQEASPKVLEKLKELTANAWKEKLEKENWTGRYITEQMQTLLVKMRLAAKLYPEYGLPEFNDEDMELIFDEFTSGIFLLRDISEDRFRNIVEDYFGKSMLAWLNKTFPDHYTLPNGKRARYSYMEIEAQAQQGGQPVQSADGVLVEISARIEDFMQLRGEHKIADGKLKVRYDILAPNFRTIQKTWDLTGFWQNTYAEVRKELRGRYPKHPWPETV